ncbi:hypothetical protein K7887_22010 (plasmid) [Sutcliffiella horikoshii]|uniref:hypothetical protein n=1 Tax=Sutcliffiella horikoshii TaxID=79883 RepID=UPI001CBD6794|nr:hypothetical protein [Sutcliffiella horikoshii]UAL49741.1 hypothetical protein K7887_22010 [Sutcliffiella horikoshii]
MKNQFISDLTEEIGTLTEVESMNFKYSLYEIEELHGEKFIVGKGEPEFVSKRNLEFDGVELLFSLINLIDEDLPEFLDEEYLNPVIKDENILKWVEKYGIPYRDQELNALLNEKKWRTNVLHIGFFKYSVASLVETFNLWKAIYQDNQAEIKKYKRAATMLESIKLESPDKDEKDILKEALAITVGSKASVTINFAYSPDTKKNHFVLEANSILDIAYYQLAALMTKPPSESKESMKNCKKCNSLFWAKHKNAKYCSNPRCNRKNDYYHRNKEK